MSSDRNRPQSQFFTPQPQNPATFAFNAYDIFANFLPGLVLLAGVLFSITFYADFKSDFSLFVVLLLATISFVFGIAIQTIASVTSRYNIFSPSEYKWSFSSDTEDENGVEDEDYGKFLCIMCSARTEPFNKKMENNFPNTAPTNNERNSDSHDTNKYFCVCCRKVFNIQDKKFEDYDALFEALIVYLENSPWNRTLRMQTLYLATRGLYISFIMLAIYYAALALFFAPITSNSIIMIENIGIDFFLFGIGSATLSYISFLRARKFEGDIVNFLIWEFILSVRNKGKFDPDTEQG